MKYHRVAYHGRPQEATGGHGRPLDAKEASSRAQIWAPDTESIPLTTQPEPLELRLFWGKKWEVASQHD